MPKKSHALDRKTVCILTPAHRNFEKALTFDEVKKPIQLAASEVLNAHAVKILKKHGVEPVPFTAAT